MTLTQEQRTFVEDLLARMTPEEKIGQMNQESPSIVGGFDVPFSELIEMLTDGRLPQEEFEKIMSTAKQDFHEEDIRAGRVGSVMGQDPRKANELQKIAVEETRLGIPLIIGFDVIHGLRSVYPIAIAEACSFDDALFEETAHMAAKESRAHGINWNFAPMIDAARDSRWGRVSEGPGEDPLLGSRFARAKIRGLQNDHSSKENYVAACMKHYVAYGACESGRDYNTTMMPASLLGMSGKLVISEDSLDITFEGEEPEEGVAYTLTDGKINFKETTTDENGNETERTVILEYHTDNTVLLTMEDDSSNMYMVFVTEENLSSGPSIFDMMQESAEGQAEEAEEQAEEVEMTEEEAEAAFAELFAQLEAEGALEENKDLDLNALLSQLNLEGLLDNVNVEELKAKFTNENGEFDRSRLLESVDVQGLAGKLFGGSEDGEGSVDLSGMLEGLFGSEAK